jgi:cytochrome c oxidase subunit 3
MGLTINDSVYSCVFFFLTGLHFFHLVVGLLLLSLLSWSSTFPSHVYTFINLRISEVHLFYNLLNFYWHFLEILWLFIFLFLYSHLFIYIYLLVIYLLSTFIPPEETNRG